MNKEKTDERVVSSFFIVKDENGNDTQDKFNLARSFLGYLDHLQKQSAMKYVIDDCFVFIFCLNLLHSNRQKCGIPQKSGLYDKERKYLQQLIKARDSWSQASLLLKLKSFF